MKVQAQLPTSMMFDKNLDNNISLNDDLPEEFGDDSESSDPDEEIQVGEEEESDNVYVNLARTLLDDDLVNLDDLEESDYTFDEWNPENFKKFFKKVLDAQELKFENLKEDIKEEAVNSVFNNMSDITKRGYEYESKNRLSLEESTEFYRQIVYESEIKNLNPEDSVDAPIILKEFYLSEGKSTEYANARIANLKDIIAEAKAVKPKLDKKIESIAEAKVEEQNLIVAHHLSSKKYTQAKLDKLYQAGELDGITFNKEIIKFLNQVLVEDEVPILIKGKEVSVSGAEAILNFHKFNDKGNFNHLVKTILYMEAPQLFEKMVVKEVETRETHRKILDNKQAKQKTNIPILTTTKPKVVYGMKL